MNSFLLLIVLASATTSAFACGKQTIPTGVVTKYTMLRPEGAREYLVYVPKSYTNNSPLPLVFAFHGMGDNAKDFLSETGMVAQADNNSFILVAPQGINSGEIFGNVFNAGTCCFFDPLVTAPDDVAFTRAIVANVTAGVCVNTQRIYTLGFSNGAMMSETLACQASDIFRAAASVAGVVELKPGNAPGIAACDASYANGKNGNAGVMNVHGLIDLVVPWGGDALLGFPPIPDSMAAWAKRAGCTSGPTTGWTRGTFSNQVWAGCQGNRTIELVQSELGGHEWPQTSDFDATAYSIQFLFRN